MNLAPTVTVNCASLTYSNGLKGIFQTIGIMRRLVKQYRINPDIRQAAINTIFLTPEKNERHETQALFCMVRDTIRYVKDIADVETIASPDKTLASKIGDCDDQSTLLAALFECVGYPTRFVVAGYVTSNPEHVYVQVLVNGDWIDCDPTEQNYFGWAPPDPTCLYFENT